MKKIGALLLTIILFTMPCMQTFALTYQVAKIDISGIKDNIKNKAKKAGDVAKDKAEDVGASISSGADKAGKKAKELRNKAGETAKDIGDKAEKTAKTMGEKAEEVSEEAKERIYKLSLPDFKSGYDKAASFFGTSVAALGGQMYVNNVATQIEVLERDLTQRINSPAYSTMKGFAAEEWHKGTFNIDAAARGSKKVAQTAKSNSLGSADVNVGEEVKASLKYYDNASETARQQAKNYIQRYGEYKSHAKNPMTMDEWLEYNKIDIKKDSPELYDSIYKDQIRIVPSDQVEEVKKALENAYKKESNNEGANRKYVAATDEETLKSITDKLKASDGTESVPLTKEESEALAKAAAEGDIDLSKFGITTDSAIKASYIAKQSLKAGATSAAIEAAIVLAPEIYEIVKYLIDTGEIDVDQLKKTGFDGLNASADGFLKGSISNAIVVMCKAGKLGADFKNASPSLVATMTILVIDGIKYGIMLGNGSLSTEEYIDVMAEEMIVSMGALGTAALVATMFPTATLAIMIGSFVGGLVVSGGYTFGKQYAIALIDNTDIGLMLPVEPASETLKGVKSKTEIELKDAIASLKNYSEKTKQDVTIKVYDLTSEISL